MRVKNYISILLLVGIGGALGLGATVATLLVKLNRAAEQSGHASSDFQLVQTFVSNSHELLAVMDILTAESSGVFLLVERLTDRCRGNLAALRDSSMFAGTSSVTKISEAFESLVEASGRAAIANETPAKEKALQHFDALAETYVGLLEDLDDRASSLASQQMRELEKRRGRTMWTISGIGIFYLAPIVLIRGWTTKRLTQPVQSLAYAAEQAMMEDKPFALEEDGPREVRTLTRAVASFVETLEAKVRERTGKIEALHKQLVDTSRRAGMAEVAASVLHNIGNVLNSVNVSEGLLTEKVRGSKAPNLTKAVVLMREHENELGPFLTEDEKGKHLPGYLVKLGEHMVQEQAIVLQELTSLTDNIEHIKAIVGMQQSYAKAVGVLEPVSLAELVEDSLKLNTTALTRHEVRVVREFADLPPAIVDKHKVLQILVNLVRNANYALDQSKSKERQLTLRVGAARGGCGRIEVGDNGIGIPKENLAKIFANGFTTKKEGHGFGLHSAALAAKEMGGSLTAHSDGPDHGATFTLDLPLKTAKVRS